MDREEAIEKLNALTGGDKESDHVIADDVLCDLLDSLGYSDVVAAFKSVEKWYA